MSRLVPPVSADDHRLGSESAPVTLVEYGDYECPHCGRAAPILREVQQRMGNRLRFVFRHFPLATMHPHAEPAAEAAEAAGAQERFWEMHHSLFAAQDALEEQDLLRRAAALGLDVQRFAADLESSVHAERVRRDFLSGVRSGVNGTPTLFVNGVRYDGEIDVASLLRGLEAIASGAAG